MINDPNVQFIMNHAGALLYGAYGLLFLLLSLWEALAPREALTQSRLRRWPVNFLLYVVSMVLLGFLSTATIANLSYYAWKSGWGLLNWLKLPLALHILLSLALIDLLGYATHWLNHRIPWLWRFHRVHHLDMDIDSSTGFNHHPAESLLTFLLRQPFILLVGPSPVAILIFDSYALVGLFVTHANVRVPSWLDRPFRTLFVTPDIHRIHHSTDWGESNSNLGVNLSLWDRIFGTYRKKPAVGPGKMTFGLAEFRSRDNIGLMRSLVFPFLKKG